MTAATIATATAVPRSEKRDNAFDASMAEIPVDVDETAQFAASTAILASIGFLEQPKGKGKRGKIKTRFSVNSGAKKVAPLSSFQIIAFTANNFTTYGIGCGGGGAV
jgi:hypothetical protein